MWLWTGWKLRKTLRRYRNDRDLEAVLQTDWGSDQLLNTFFSDIGERLHGEEITKLRQKQAEYLALQNQINPHFLYNTLGRRFGRMRCWRIVKTLPRPRKHWPLFFAIPSPM